jgi:hypothetical protein
MVEHVAAVEAGPETESFQRGLQRQRPGPPDADADDLHGTT